MALFALLGTPAMFLATEPIHQSIQNSPKKEAPTAVMQNRPTIHQKKASRISEIASFGDLTSFRSPGQKYMMKIAIVKATTEAPGIKNTPTVAWKQLPAPNTGMVMVSVPRKPTTDPAIQKEPRAYK